MGSRCCLEAASLAGNDFFVPYLVFLLAAVGENPSMVVLGATVASAVSCYAGWNMGHRTNDVLVQSLPEASHGEPCVGGP